MHKHRPLFLIFINALVILFYLLVCLIPFVIESSLSWFVSLIGMGFPYLLGAIIIFLVLWIVFLRRPAAKQMLFINILCIVIGFQQIRATFAFHFFSSGDVTERPEGIRVMSWNVTGWDIRNWDVKGHHTFQPLMFDFIEQTNPDVLLLQEFFNCTDPGIVVSYVDLLSKRGYPYYYFTPHSLTVGGAFQSGLGLFSKYPISDTAFFFPQSGGHSEGFQYADIEIKNRKVRFFNAHLESAGMTDDDVEAAGKISGGRTIFYKLKRAHYLRMDQARMLKSEMERSPHPVVLGADVDDLPNSTIYFYLKKNMQDAFTKKGSGIGRTFPYIVPNLRIDYLFASPGFRIQSFFLIPRDYSVHYPIISDLSE